MIEGFILMAIAMVGLQVWRANTILIGIYAILERAHRPTERENDYWVSEHERQLRDWHIGPRIWPAVGGLLGVLIMAAWALWFFFVR